MLTLIVILTLASALFSITAYSFLGVYNGFTNYVGEEKNVIAVYSKVGSTPFSGIVPIDLVNQVSTGLGVLAVSPEIIAPSTINDQSVFIRGVIPQELAKLNPVNMVEGQPLSINDTDSAIVGEGLANRLHLQTGDRILAFSVLSKRYVELQVKGIFQSDSSLNDEALVPLYVGQWIRGINYNEATLLRIKIDPAQTGANQIYQQIANATATSTPASSSPAPTPKSQIQRELEALIPQSQGYINIGNIGIEESQQFMQNYLDRYGISKDTLIVLSVVVLFFACGTAVCAISLFVKQHSSDIDTLRSLGVSERKIKADLAVRMVVWASAATLIGTALSAVAITVFGKVGYLQVLSHAIIFQLDPLIVAANFVFLSLLIGVSIARMELRQ